MSSERYRPNVLVAEYVYRHEAEFAAGFLTDAGIPHRLQADDAGGADMGATMGRPARIWVRAEDAPEARELLEVTPEAAVSAPPDEEDEAPVVGLFIRSALEASGHMPGGVLARSDGALSMVERIQSALLGVALGGVGGAVASSGMASAVALAGVTLALGSALIFVGCALTGSAFGPFRRLLRALSGSTP